MTTDERDAAASLRGVWADEPLYLGGPGRPVDPSSIRQTMRRLTVGESMVIPLTSRTNAHQLVRVLGWTIVGRSRDADGAPVLTLDGRPGVRIWRVA